MVGSSATPRRCPPSRAGPLTESQLFNIEKSDLMRVLREEPGPCDLILRGAAEAAKNDIQLDAPDVARCVDPFPVAPFLEFDEPSTCRSPWAKAFSFPDEDPPPPKPWYGEL